MIITAEEYRSMGFTCDDDELLESCLSRAEYTLSAITEGRYAAALAAGGQAAEYVRQAAAFQTDKLVKQEQRISAGRTQRVAVGDFSYQESTESADAPDDDGGAFEMSMQTIHALRAAGCLFSGREVLG